MAGIPSTTATETTPGASATHPPRVNVLGVGISAINLAGAHAAVAEALAQRRKGYICVTGVHGVMEAQADPAFRQILNRAFLCTPDGMPMVWLGRLRGFRQISRVYGPDLMLELCEWSRSTGHSHFLFGGDVGVAGRLRQLLEARFPGLRILGTYTPPFRPMTAIEAGDLRRQVADLKPDIIWVGLSTPKQEQFMAAHLLELDTTLMIGVGAAFDFHSGRVRQAPRWMQRSGLEWMFRLCQEPRRLRGRYLRNNPRFVLCALAQLAGLRKYPLD
jgi:N-acetylglucosaminyldiphosphoundecaprenol N-acetyl-beta-D-mannosaminyltransferase